MDEGLSQNGGAEESLEQEGIEKEKEDGEEESEEDEREEGRVSVGRKSPKMPTKAEREEHRRTHCPYRSWCPHCEIARKKCSAPEARG